MLKNLLTVCPKVHVKTHRYATSTVTAHPDDSEEFVQPYPIRDRAWRILPGKATVFICAVARVTGNAAGRGLVGLAGDFRAYSS